MDDGRCPRCGATDPRLPNMVGTVLCDSTWHLQVVSKRDGSEWLKIGGAALLGAFIGWLLGQTFGPMPPWVPYVVLAALLTRWLYRSHRDRDRQDDGASRNSAPDSQV